MHVRVDKTRSTPAETTAERDQKRRARRDAAVAEGAADDVLLAEPRLRKGQRVHAIGATHTLQPADPRHVRLPKHCESTMQLAPSPPQMVPSPAVTVGPQ